MLLVKCHQKKKGRVMQALSHVLGNKKIKKVLQNALYDAFVLAYRYGILVRGIEFDTMLAGVEIYPELPKLLVCKQLSIPKNLTTKLNESHKTCAVLHICCKDSAVTYEIMQQQQRVFQADPKKQAHFDFNMAMLEPLLYMEMRGILYDQEAAKQLHAQELLNTVGNRITHVGTLRWPTQPELACTDLFYAL